MRLRELKLEDAEPMLEWMQDKFVVHDLQTDFMKMTIDDCKNFIRQARKQYIEKDPHNLHYAITSIECADFNEYLGTVSLKNINNTNRQAEFAIAIRRKAMGRGQACLAMQEILRIGFERLELRLIYWYVSPQNIRANRFYEKNGYRGVSHEIFILEQKEKYQISDLVLDPTRYIWYYIKKEPHKIG